MRYVTIVMDPDPGVLHPVERRLAEEPDLTRRAIHTYEELADGSIAMLTEVEGDLDRYRAIVEDAEAVHEYAVAGDESGFCFSRVEPTPAVRELMAQRASADFLVRMPIEYTDDGGQRITMVGREEDFVGRPIEPPESFDVQVVATGPYRPEADGVVADLTTRQREVLRTAVRMGYYETPREATLADVAEPLDIEAGTVGKHLRSVESRVFSSLAV